MARPSRLDFDAFLEGDPNHAIETYAQSNE